jgi:hypothetical protein
VSDIRVDNDPTGCLLFGKLAGAARALAGADMLRSQIFAIPVATVRAWIARCTAPRVSGGLPAAVPRLRWPEDDGV